MLRILLIVINIVLLFTGIILVEIGIRIFIEYEPGYYTGIHSKDSCIQYQYGENGIRHFNNILLFLSDLNSFPPIR